MIKNCVIEDCEANLGGGISTRAGGAPSLDSCTVRGCFAGTRGGGIYVNNSDPTLTDLVIEDNGDGVSADTQYGGGLAVYDSELTMASCIVRGNLAGTGGGIYLQKLITATITDTDVVDGNYSGGYGGGVSIGADCTITLLRCRIMDNTAEFGGGGIHTDVTDSLTVYNCLVVRNQGGLEYNNNGGGGAIFGQSTVTLANCTFTKNSTAVSAGGGGIKSNSSTVAAKNCILWGKHCRRIKQSNCRLDEYGHVYGH